MSSPIIIDQTQVNPASFQVPAVYLVVEPPQASITGLATNVIGRVGSASWGPVNTPVLVGSLADQTRLFGGVSTLSPNDPYDMATDTWASLQQASQLGLFAQQVRVTDGTDAAASLTLDDNQGNTTGLVVGGTKTTSDVINLTFTNSKIAGSPVTVTYTVLSGDTLALIATALKVAINANAALAAAGITATNPSSAHVNVISNDLDIIPTIGYTQGMNSESITITAGTPVVGGTLNALYTGILGNSIRLNILPGTSSNLVNVQLTAWPGKDTEFYPGLPNTSAFWAALQTALAGGGGSSRPPSQLCSFTLAGSGSPQAPQQLISSALAGGTDGRSGLTDASLIGSPTGGSAGQGSGMYSLLNANPFPSMAWLVGLQTQALWPTMQQFGSQNGVFMVVCEPINTTPTQASVDLETYGINNYQVMCVIDWPQMFDPVNNVYRYVYPAGPFGGFVAALSPEQSPLNKPMQGIEALSRLKTVGPYSNADIALANTNGIALVSNPIAAGVGFGFITAVNTSLNNIGTSPIEYTTMTNFLIKSVGRNLGQFLGKLQTQQPVDPLRSAIKSNINAFLAQLVSNSQLDAYKTLCEFSLTNNSPGYNTPNTIAKHICSVFVAATYESSVWYLLFTLQGGTTVSVQNVVSNQPAS